MKPLFALKIQSRTRGTNGSTRNLEQLLMSQIFLTLLEWNQWEMRSRCSHGRYKVAVDGKIMDKETELTNDVRDIVRFIGIKSIGTVMQVFTLMVQSISWWSNDGKTNWCNDWRQCSCSVHWKILDRKCFTGVHTDGTKYKLMEEPRKNKLEQLLTSVLLFCSLENTE